MGNDYSHFAGESFADAGDAIEEISPIFLFGEMEETATEVDGEDIDFDEFFKFVGGFFVGFGLSQCFGGGRFWEGFAGNFARFGEGPSGEPCEGGEDEERQSGHSWGDAEEGEHHGGDGEGAWVKGELFADVGAEVGIFAGSGDENTGGDADHEGGDLGDQTIADGEDGIFLQGFDHGEAFLDDADGKAAEDIDEGDENSGDGIAPDELTGPVHGAVEVGFLLDLGSADCGGGFVDEARVHFGIDAHLFTGHGIEGEAGGDFGDAAGALGDDHEIDDHED